MSRQRPGKSASRGKAQRSGCQQAVVPARRGGCHVGNGQKRQQRARRRRNHARAVAGDDETAAGHRRIDRRHLIVGVGHVLVVFVTKPEIEFQTARYLPTVLNVEMPPIGVGVHGGASQAHLRGGRIAQQEVGERVPIPQSRRRGCESRRERKDPAGSIRIHRLQIVVHQIRAELDVVRPPMKADVVEELEIAVVAKREQRRIAHGGELSAEGDLREAHIQRIRGHALQSCLRGERISGIRAGLAAGYGQKRESRLIQKFGREDVGPAGHAVQRMGAQVAAESGQQALLQYSRSKRDRTGAHRTARIAQRRCRSRRTGDPAWRWHYCC